MTVNDGFNLFLDHSFLAEFVIMLGDKSKTVEKFQKNLTKNGAEFPVSIYI